MKKTLFSISFILLLTVSCTNQGTVYIVDQKNPAANDSGPGNKKEPFKTIGAAAARVKPGEKVLIRSGIYRETVDLKISGTKGDPIIFEAADKNEVIIRGSIPVRGWNRKEKESPVYLHEGWTKYFGKLTSPDVKNTQGQVRRRDGRDFPRNLVFSDGEYIPEVFYPDSIKEKSFFIDQENQRIYLWLLKGEDPNNKLIEVADRACLFNADTNNYIIIRRIRFERGANGPQGGQALVKVRGNNCLVEDCSMSQAAATGFGLSGRNNIVRRCVFNNNGQQGFTVSSSVDCRLEDCESSYNNNTPDKAFSTNWEAGGNKIARSYRLVIDRHTAHYNNGDGIWLDISNNECEVKNCLCTNNRRSGIFWEISFVAYIHDNVLMGNSAQGILLAESKGPIVERNIMIGNTNGLTFRDMLRTTSPAVDSLLIRDKEEAIWNHNEVVKNNILAFNHNSQVRGAFLNKIERMVPAALQKRETGSHSIDPMVLAAKDYQARDEQGQPVGLSLEKLNIKVDNNFYWGGTVPDLYQWGDLKFQTLDQVKENLKFEENGKIIDPQFADWKNLDLRVRKESPLLKLGCYPQGEIPGVKLGIIRQ